MTTYGLLQYKAMGRTFPRSVLRENPFPIVTYKLSWEVSRVTPTRIIGLVAYDQRHIDLTASAESPSLVCIFDMPQLVAREHE